MVIVYSFVEEDCHMTCKEIVHEANILPASVSRILAEILQKRKVAVTCILHQLPDDNKANPKVVAECLLKYFEAEKENFLNRINIIDET
jgi:hypothetical protein